MMLPGAVSELLTRALVEVRPWSPEWGSSAATRCPGEDRALGKAGQWNRLILRALAIGCSIPHRPASHTKEAVMAVDGTMVASVAGGA